MKLLVLLHIALFTHFAERGPTHVSGGDILSEVIVFYADARSESSVYLEWVMAKEEGIVAYHVQRAVNDTEFETIGTCLVNGNSEGTTYYDWTDDEIVSASQHYRLVARTKLGTEQVLADCIAQ